MSDPGSSVALLARLLLVVTLGVSGSRKLRADTTTAKALEALGVSDPARRDLAGKLLPIAELALAIWLLTGWHARLGALATFALILVFNATLWRLQRIGYQGGCGCFGDEGTGPVRRVHLARNTVLMMAAAVLLGGVWSGPRDAAPVWTVPPAALAGSAVALAVLFGLYFLGGAAERLLFRAYWR